MDVRTVGCAYGIIYVRTYSWTDRQAVRLSNWVGRTCILNYICTERERERELRGQMRISY